MASTNRIDLSGKTFGRLFVTGKTKLEKEVLFWECICNCGTICFVRGQQLRIGKTLSCGCLHRDMTSKASYIHGMSHKQIHNIWCSIKQRCNNVKNSSYHNYGGRGITICDEWLDFDRFYSDMGECPAGMTIDRIDNDKGYFKENCHWATRKEQANNRRNGKKIEFNGVEKTQAEWEDFLSLPRGIIWGRLNRGWSIERALTTKLLPNGGDRKSINYAKKD